MKYKVTQTYIVEVPDAEFDKVFDYVAEKGYSGDVETLFETLREFRNEAYLEFPNDLAKLEEKFRELRLRWLIESLVEMSHIGEAGGLVFPMDTEIETCA